MRRMRSAGTKSSLRVSFLFLFRVNQNFHKKSLTSLPTPIYTGLVEAI